MGSVIMNELNHIDPGCVSTIVGGYVLLQFDRGS